jgi:peptidoglycan/LPS O-acetylase OafA/YrhL
VPLPSSLKTDIPALTGLRGIAALWVFIFHAEATFNQLGAVASKTMLVLGAAGFLGVDLFFVLSGFVLALNYSAESTHRSLATWFEFLWKRIARVYPVHLVALALVVVLTTLFTAFDSVFLPASRLTLGGLIKSLLLTHGWSIPIAKTWNTVSWSISCEWAAYLAFPLVALAASRVRSALGTCAVIVGLFALLSGYILNSNYASSMSYGLPRIAAEFTAGVLLYRLWELRELVKGARGDWIAFIALVILIAGGSQLVARANTYIGMVYMPIFVCGVVYGLASGNGLFCRILSSRAAQWGGHVSYAFYMVHGLILGVASRVLMEWGKMSSTSWAVAFAVISVVVTALVATAIYVWIETPARRAMVGWFDRVTGKSLRTLAARQEG